VSILIVLARRQIALSSLFTRGRKLVAIQMTHWARHSWKFS
jgi:hypothetical protein